MFIYVIQGPTERIRGKIRHHVKIGYSRHPLDRMKELQVGSPIKLKMLGTAKCKSLADAKQAEKLAHRMFKYHRHHGEWFRMPDKQMDQLRNFLRMSSEYNRFTLIRDGQTITDPRDDPSEYDVQLNREYREIMRGM